MAESCNNLGDLYSDLNRYTEAEKYSKRAYEICKRQAERNPEAYDEDLAIVCHTIGELYHKMGKERDAKEYCNQAVRIIERMKSRGGEVQEIEEQINELLAMLDEEE